MALVPIDGCDAPHVTTYDRRRPLYEAAGALGRAALAERGERDRLRAAATRYESDGRDDLAARVRAAAEAHDAEDRRLSAEAERLRREGDAIPCPNFMPDPDDADICSDCSDYRCFDCGDHHPDVSTYDGLPLCGECSHERFRDDPDLPLWTVSAAFLTTNESIRN